ncbi:hypothetical protein AJ80_08392 [Polytolypa hystricis UAMH7299]|uniref:Large ribosomal subunit protein mL38 n=1 Tax=Polytolypa hystricis (strain UAMH7299) TaxID=1447883 RepID=A0A2B7X7W5_POLH7|nr:hypothetical protein AJ80_08392 [Polytolypa hystricis UAMH7299]
MAHCELAMRPLSQCLRQTYRRSFAVVQLQSSRTLTSTTPAQEEAQAEPASPSFSQTPNPELVSSPRLERKLMRAGISPIGSRRRRAALQGSANIPFEQLPYQCFQEARNVLMEDREAKVKLIEAERAKIAKLRATDASEVTGGEDMKQKRLKSMENRIEVMKIYADINDPMVKKRFEDGLGDMNRPIYRYLANRKWREYRRPVLVQRITQMNVVPDVLPHADPTVDVKLYFGRRDIHPGDFVTTRVSADMPRLGIQSFEKGEKLVTIAFIDPDVPNAEADGFDYRCNFLAINIPISHVSTYVALDKLSESQVVLPWYPPYALKGSPYHRVSVFIMEQKDQAPLDRDAVAAKAEREGLRLRSLETRHQLKPIGAHLFRTKWDETTEAVMNERGIEGVDVEFRRKRVEPLPYKRRNPSSFR